MQPEKSAPDAIVSPPRAPKQTGLLFHPYMVEALKIDKKRVTRRVGGLAEVNKHPDRWELIDFYGVTARFKRKYLYDTKEKPEILEVKNPYGQEGDYIWARESCWIHRGFKAGVNDAILTSAIVEYCADIQGDKDKTPNKEYYKLYPSIHMPKAACRFWLRNQGVRLERLHDITEQEAIAEGVLKWDTENKVLKGSYRWYTAKPLKSTRCGVTDAKGSFWSLWEAINGDGSYARNPWVWRISFEPQLTRPQMPWE